MTNRAEVIVSTEPDEDDAKPRSELLSQFIEEYEAGETDDPGAFLQQHPGRPEGLREDIEEFIRLASALKNTASSPDDDAVTIGLPEQIGAYRILRLLGEGGMGVVYLAEQETPRRHVALKVIRPGPSSQELLRRFAHETELLGKLDHPGIARIFDAGSASMESGPTPFFAMEYVDGRPLTQYALSKNLSTRECLQLIARVCRAVEHAHDRGVVHRDLKPSNILIDITGAPRVLDFGVARVIGENAETMGTSTGHLVGTLSYMSPEQVTDQAHTVDARSDVYALGVVAYELLAGRLPYQIVGRTVPQACRTIEEEIPLPLGRADRSLRGDIEIMIGHALEKERNRRYPSAASFADDIERYLRDEPIEARRPSARYQMMKFAVRNKALSATMVSTFLAFVVATAALSSAYFTQKELLESAEERQRISTAAEKQSLQALLNRGDWHGVIGAVDRLLKIGVEDEVALKIDRVLAWIAIDEVEAAREGIDALVEGNSFQEHDAEVRLLQGRQELRYGDGAQAKRQIREALSLGLPLADEYFARGLLAETVPDTIRWLTMAIDRDPRHHGAHSMLLVMLMAASEREQAGRQARDFSLIFPDDPAVRTYSFFEYALRGDFESAENVLYTTDPPMDPPLVRVLGKLLNSIANMRETDFTDPSSWVLLSTMFADFTDLIGPTGSSTRFAWLTTAVAAMKLPALQAVLKGTFQGQMNVLAQDWAEAGQKFEEAARCCPRAETYLMAGVALENASKEGPALTSRLTSEDYFRGALQLPAFDPGAYRVARSALIDVLCRRAQLEPLEAATRDQCIAHILTETFGDSQKPDDQVVRGDQAHQLGDSTLARLLLERAEASGGETLGTLRLRAVLEAEAEDFAAAFLAARRALQQDPDDARMKAIHDTAMDRL